jgi:hypothetical protein
VNGEFARPELKLALHLAMAVGLVESITRNLSEEQRKDVLVKIQAWNRASEELTKSLIYVAGK